MAREQYEQALTLMRQAGLPWGSADTFLKLGILLMVQGHWEAAAPYFEEGLALAEQRQERLSWCLAQSDLAERDLVSRQPQQAYERLAPLAEQTNRESVPLEPRTMLAWAHLEREEVDQTQRLLDQILPQARQQHLHPVLVMALLVQARLLARLGNWQECRHALDEALRLAQAMQYPYLEAKALSTSGYLARHQGASAQASGSFAQALAILGRLGERLYAQHIEAALTILKEAEQAPL